MMLNEDCVQCPLCQKIFESPIILPCGETVCKKCLPENYKSYIYCSLCKEMHSTPEKGFPINKLLEKTLQSAFNDDKVKCLRKSKVDFFTDLENFRNEIDSAEVNIIDYCRSIINEIDLKTETIIQEVNTIREGLINKVVDYEKLCLSKWKNYKEEFKVFLDSNASMLNETSFDSIKFFNSEKCLEVFKNLELEKSKLFYEKSRLKSLVFNETLMALEPSKVTLDKQILGELSIKEYKEIKLSNLTKIHLQDSPSRDEKTDMIQSEILSENKFVLSYNCPDFKTFFVELYELNTKKQINKYNEKYDYSYFLCIIKTFKDKIYVYKNQPNSLLIFDEELNKLESKLLIDSLSSFLVTEKYVLTFNSTFTNGGILSVYDPNMNFLTSIKGNGFNSFIQFPEKVNEMYKNKNFYFFRDDNSITVVNEHDGKIVKKFEFADYYEIIKITDQNLLIVTTFCKSLIIFFDFDRMKRGEKMLTDIYHKTKIFVDDNLNIKLFDPITMNIYI